MSPQVTPANSTARRHQMTRPHRHHVTRANSGHLVAAGSVASAYGLAPTAGACATR